MTRAIGCLRSKIGRSGALLLLVLVLGTSAYADVIIFDNTQPSGGTLTYSGVDGSPVSGSGIVFDIITGTGTPLNNNVTIACVACSLAFTSGPNTSEGPPVWQFGAGGTFTLTGTVPAAGILAPTALITGTFSGVVIFGDNVSLGFTGIGIDTKDPRLAAFYGITDPNFQFNNTEITATPNFTGGGGFTANVDEADLRNTSTPAIPEPASLTLLGLGLIASAIAKRRKLLG